MNLILKKLKIENFKGLKNLDITFDGDELHSEISGANGTGKSTIYDAYIWLLFDKNASGDKDFSIKPRQTDGEEKHYQNIRVLGEFALDDKILQLEKIYSEVWTKKRGEETQEYGGNTTEYYINAVPRKAGEYKNYISSLISEDKFKMLTSAKYFNEGMSWQERRKLLFEIIGDSSEENIINEYSDSSDVNIVAVTNGLPAEDALKMYKHQIQKTNADLANIPVRIDEASRFIQNTETADESKIKSEIKDIQEIINSIDRQIVEKRNFQREVNEKLRDISNLKVKISEREFELKNAGMEVEIEKNRLERAIRTLEDSKNTAETDISRSIQIIADKEAERDGLRRQYSDVAGKIFEIDEDTLKCITCGQDLPTDMKAAGIEQLRNDFESDKMKKLTEIKRKGDYLNSEIETAGKAIEKSNEFLNTQNKLIEQTKNHISKIKIQPLEETDVNTDPEIIKLNAVIQQLQADIDNIAVDTADALIKEKALLMEKLVVLNETLGKNARIKESRERVAALKADEKELSGKLLDMQHKLHLVEDYIKFKCGYIADSINGLFANAKFKLFDNLINGGISETCECLIDGVPYSDANNAAKINTGLEIANVLSGHFDFYAPIFIDNAECVNDIYKTDSQTIMLSVSVLPGLSIDHGNITEQVIFKPEIIDIEGVA